MRNICILLETQNWESADYRYCLKDIIKYCNACFILDNNSKDNTLDKLKDYCISNGVTNFKNYNKDGEDKNLNWLLQKAKALSGSKWIAKVKLNYPYRIMEELENNFVSDVLSSTEDALNIPYIQDNTVLHHRSWIWNSDKDWEYDISNDTISIQGDTSFSRKKVSGISLIHGENSKQYALEQRLQIINKLERNLFTSSRTFKKIMLLLGGYLDSMIVFRDSDKVLFIEMLERCSKYLTSLQMLARSHDEKYVYSLYKARYLILHDNLEKAELEYKKAVLLFPEKNETYMLLCDLYELMGKHDLIIEICDLYLTNEDRVFKKHGGDLLFKIEDSSCYYHTGMKGYYCRKKAEMFLDNTNLKVS